MNNLQKVAYATAGLSLLAVNNVNAAISVNTNIADPISTQKGLVEGINEWLTIILNLLYFIAVIFGIYGGFQILTAAGDEEKVKKGKTTLINAVIGLLVIFLAGAIIRFVVQLFTTGTVT